MTQNSTEMPRMAQNHPNCPRWLCMTPNDPSGPKTALRAIGIMVTTHFDLAFGLFRARFGPKRAQIGSKLKIVGKVLCDLSKFAQEDHSANEENIIMIR